MYVSPLDEKILGVEERLKIHLDLDNEIRWLGRSEQDSVAHSGGRGSVCICWQVQQGPSAICRTTLRDFGLKSMIPKKSFEVGYFVSIRTSQQARAAGAKTQALLMQPLNASGADPSKSRDLVSTSPRKGVGLTRYSIAGHERM